MRVCDCDWGFAGADCSEVLCPVGDNPFTQSQQQLALRLDLDDAGTDLTGTPGLQFSLRLLGHPSGHVAFSEGAYAGTTLQREAFADAMEAAIESSLPVSAATVLPMGSAGSQHSYAVLLTFATSPFFNNLLLNMAAPSAGSVTCTFSDVLEVESAATCSVSALDVGKVVVSGLNSAKHTYRLAVFQQPRSAPATVVVSVDAGPYITASPFTMSASVPEDISVFAPGAPAGDVTVLFPESVGHTLGAVWEVGPALDDTGADSTYVIKPGTREVLPCGGVGTCDHGTGSCRCPAGTSGRACSALDLANEDEPSLPIHDVLAADPAFDGTIMKVRSTRPYGSDFKFFEVSAADQPPALTLFGNGMLETRDIRATGSATVGSGGLIVDNDGITITGGGLVLRDHSSSNDLHVQDGLVRLSSATTAEDHVVLRSSALTAAGKSMFLVQGPPSASVNALLLEQLDGTDTVSIDGTGNFRALIGDAEVSTGDLRVLQGHSLLNNDAGVGASISGTTLGADISSSSVGTGLDEGTLRVRAEHAAFGGSALMVQANREGDTAFNLVRVSANTATASEDYLQIRGDGLLQAFKGGQVNEGFTVHDGGLDVADGDARVDDLVQTNKAGGVSVLGSFTMPDDPGDPASSVSIDILGQVSVSSQSGVDILGSTASAGSSLSSGSGAPITIRGGESTGMGRPAGSVSIIGGASSSSSDTGSVLLSTADVGGTSGSAFSGDIVLATGGIPGSGPAASGAGSIILSGGGDLAPGGSNSAGAVSVVGGFGTDSAGGQVVLSAGASTASTGATGVGGALSLFSGEGHSAGGDITIRASRAAAGTSQGTVSLQAWDPTAGAGDTGEYVPFVKVESDGALSLKTAEGKDISIQAVTDVAQPVASVLLESGAHGGHVQLSTPAGAVSIAAQTGIDATAQTGAIYFSAGSLSDASAGFQAEVLGDISLSAGVDGVGSLALSAGSSLRMEANSGDISSLSSTASTFILVGSSGSSTTKSLTLGAHASDTSGASVSVRGGVGATVGGAVSVVAGAGSGASTDGGAILLSSGQAGGASSMGGALSLLAGHGSAAGAGGAAWLQSGSATSDGLAGGELHVQAGEGFNGAGGSVSIAGGGTAGPGAVGDGGSVTVRGGGTTDSASSLANAAGGSVSIIAGAGTTSDGTVQVQSARQAGSAEFGLQVSSGSTVVGGGSISVLAGTDSTVSDGKLFLASGLGQDVHVHGASWLAGAVGDIELSGGGGGALGGSVSLIGGGSTTVAGHIFLSGGTASLGTGAAGGVSVLGGDAVVVDGPAGSLLLSGGEGTGGGAGSGGGHISIVAGTAAGSTATAVGGNVVVKGGFNTGVASGRQAGNVILSTGEDSSGGGQHGAVQVKYVGDVTAIEVTHQSTVVEGRTLELGSTAEDVLVRSADVVGRGIKVHAGGAATPPTRGGYVDIAAAPGDGVPGGAVSITAGSSDAGGAAGGRVVITSGTGVAPGATSGGIALTSADSGASGSSGDLTVASGSAAGAAEASGNIILQTGSASSTAAAGHVSVLAGVSTGGTGGSVFLSAGAGAVDGSVSVRDAQGEDVVVVTSTSFTVQQQQVSFSTTSGPLSAATHTGQTLSILGGGGPAATSGGHVIIRSGAHTSGSSAGSISITAGDNSHSAGTPSGGHVVLAGGASTAPAATSAEGGSVSLLGGSGVHQGGGVHVAGGGSSGHIQAGHVTVVSGEGSGAGAAGHLSLIAGGAVSGEAGSIVLSAGTSTSGANGRAHIFSGTGRKVVEVFDGSVTLSSGEVSIASDTGDITIQAQAAQELKLIGEIGTGAAGGGILMKAGNSDLSAGHVSILSGDSSHATGAGPLVLSAGTATASNAQGGDIHIMAGESTSAVDSVGGHLVLKGGRSGANGVLGPGVSAGHVSIVGGSSVHDAPAGRVLIAAGECEGSGVPTCNGGDVILSATQRASSGTLDGKVQLFSGDGTLAFEADSLTHSTTIHESHIQIHGGQSVSIMSDDSASSLPGKVLLSSGEGSAPFGGGPIEVLGGRGGGDGGWAALRGGPSSTAIGGAVSVTAGAGSTAAGRGGHVLVQGGQGSASSSGGGAVSILGGEALGGSGGDVILRAATGVGANGAIRAQDAGGNLGLLVENGQTQVAGTQTLIRPLNGDVMVRTGQGHDIALDFYDATAGEITMTAGGSAAGTAGGVTITGGEATSAAATSGSVVLQPGLPGAGSSGSVILRNAHGSAASALVLSPGSTLLSSDASTRVASAPGSPVTIAAGGGTGTASLGSHLIFEAGGSSVAAGSVSITAGDGGSAGGSVDVWAGSGTTPGRVRLLESDGLSASVTVEDGLTTINGDAVLIDSAGSGAGQVSITTAALPGSVVSIEAGRGRLGSNGGAVAIHAGKSTSGGVPAGAVLIEGGEAASGDVGETGGAVTLSGGASTAVGGPAVVSGGDSTTDSGSGGHVSLLSGAGGRDGVGGNVILLAEGGATSPASGNGNGGHVSITAGAGTGTGTAGLVTIRAGADGTPAGGALRLQSGDGSSSQLQMTNTEVSINTPTATLQTSTGILRLQSAEGSYVRLIAGNEATGANGGDVEILSGRSTSAAGGAVSVVGGPSTTAAGGAVALAGGQGAGSGGQISMTGGSGRGGGEHGGNLALNGGAGAGGAEGGDVSITSGAAAGAARSGSIFLSTAATLGTGDTGNVVLQTGSPTAGHSGHMSILTGVASAGDEAGNIMLQPGQADAVPQHGKVVVLDAAGTVALSVSSGTTEVSASSLLKLGSTLHVEATAGLAGHVSIVSGSTGTVLLSSAGTPGGTAGPISIVPGAGVVGGSLTIGSGNGDAPTGNSGEVVVKTGTATGNAGTLLLSGGHSTFAGAGPLGVAYSAGTVSILGGAAADNPNSGANLDSAGGDIVLSAGSAAGDEASARGGHVSILSGQGTAAGSLVLSATGASGNAVVASQASTSIGGSEILLSSATGPVQARSVGGQAVSILGGGGPAGVVGGNVVLEAGGHGSGSGGDIEINGGSSSATAFSGGDVSISAGSSSAVSSGTGGALALQSGDGSGTGAASGPVSLKSGNVATGTVGEVLISAGTATSSGSAGSISLVAGAAPTAGNDGSIILSLAGGVARDGAVSIRTPSTTVFQAEHAFTTVQGPKADIVTTDAGDGALTLTSAASQPVRIHGGGGLSGTIGGAVELVAGAHASAAASDVSISGGRFTGTGASAGGAVVLRGGAATTGSTGGFATLGGGTGNAGGDAKVEGGAGVVGSGGTVQVEGGTSPSQGGAVDVRGGSGTGGGLGGHVRLFAGSGSTSGDVQVHRVASHDASTLALEVSDLRTTLAGQHALIQGLNGGSAELRGPEQGSVLLSVVDTSAGGAGQGIKLAAGARSGSSTSGGTLELLAGSGAGHASSQGGDLIASAGSSEQSSGGVVEITGGAGGSGSGSGQGGIVSITGGAGGSATAAGTLSAGHVLLQGGPASNTANGGSISLLASSGHSSGNGGSVLVAAAPGAGGDGTVIVRTGAGRDAVLVTSTDLSFASDTISIQADGVSTGTVTLSSGGASALSLLAGPGAPGVNGGSVSIMAGNSLGADAASHGGSLQLNAGAGSAANDGGQVALEAGSGRNGGAVSIQAGTGTSTAGQVHLSAGSVGGRSGADLELGGAHPGDASDGDITLQAGGGGGAAGGDMFLLTGAGSSQGSFMLSIGSETTARIAATESSTAIGSSTIGGGLSLTSRDSLGSTLALSAGSNSGSFGSAVSLTAGRGSGAVDGGSVSILAGNGHAGSDGGDVELRAGSGTTNGQVRMLDGAGSTVQAFGSDSWAVTSQGTVSIFSHDGDGINIAAGQSSGVTPSTGGGVSLAAEDGSTLGGSISLQAGNNGGSVVIAPGSSGSVEVKSSDGTAAIRVKSDDTLEFLKPITFTGGAELSASGPMSTHGVLKIPSQETPGTAYTIFDVATRGAHTALSPFDVRNTLVLRIFNNGPSGGSENVHLLCDDGQLLYVLNEDVDTLVISRQTCGAPLAVHDTFTYNVAPTSIGLYFCNCPSVR